MPLNFPVVKGYDWSEGVNYEEILKIYSHTGFQATNFGKAVKIIREILIVRDESQEEDEFEEDEFIKRKNGCTVFFGFTKSSGLREAIRFLVQNMLVDCVVTSAGEVEDDLIKCLSSTTKNEHFERWVEPLLDEMLIDQNEKSILWTPSKVIERLGLRINSEDSIFYWAAINKIPVFCPELLDGLLGGIMYRHSNHNPGLILDILSDLNRINNIAMKAKKSAIISVGAGVVKHHMCKANCIRDGADFAVYLNTSPEFDGSDSGAEPDESVACGKIKTEAFPVKIHGDPALIFPLLVAETFAKHVHGKT